ncbi:hypothetical protein GCM10025762_08850 [Haloechinothrix salitolerans]
MPPARPTTHSLAMGPHPTEELPRATGAPAMNDAPTLSVGLPHAEGLPSAAEWERLERGVAQRVRALDAFLSDVYGDTADARVLADGVLPRRLVTTSARFRREAVGISQPVRVVVASVDVVRDEHGTFRAIADDLSCPAWPAHVAPHLLRALRAVTRVADPVVLALAPSHSALARQPGVTTVAGRGLVCRENTVYHDNRRVDVLYRTVADDLLDPLHFQPDSAHGVSGLLNAARAGSVTLANAAGNGLGEDPLIHRFVPRLVEYYLGEHPILPVVDKETVHTTHFLPVNAAHQRFPDLSTAPSTADMSPVSLRLFAVNDGVSVTVLSDAVGITDLSTSNIPQRGSTVETTVLW